MPRQEPDESGAIGRLGISVAAQPVAHGSIGYVPRWG
jgi:hypothetical protein